MSCSEFRSIDQKNQPASGVKLTCPRYRELDLLSTRPLGLENRRMPISNPQTQFARPADVRRCSSQSFWG